MKKSLFFKILIIFAFSNIIVGSHSYSQPSKDTGNIYTKWKKLALLGKNQAEIEYFFRNEKEIALSRVKERIRFAVMENLRRAGIKKLIRKISDADDFNVIVRIIGMEIRYAGIEHDEDLLLTIKEEFGVELESL